MNNELIIKKCNKCGSIVYEIKKCNCDNCGIKCCNEDMSEVLPNTVDASIEKHIPTYERVEDEIFVKVNHVMEKEHYIMWIALVKDNKFYIEYLYPEQNAECRFKYIPESTIYAYCNKHELWESEKVK